MTAVKPKLIVLGGGFTGAYVAKKLEDTFCVILIDTKDYFEFTPGVLRSLMQPKTAKQIQILHTTYLKQARFIQGKAERITTNSVTVLGKQYPFDYLVIATGSHYTRPFKQGNVVAADRGKKLREHTNDVKLAQNILIIGGGPVGVELASEIKDSYPEKHISIIHPGSTLMHKYSGTVGSYVTTRLKNQGVVVYLEDRATRFTEGSIETKKGKNFAADLVFSCTGIRPNIDFLNGALPLNEHKQLVVNEHLQIVGHPHIFAGGDVIHIKEQKLAQNAELHARTIITNLKRTLKQKSLKTYTSKERIMLLTLGKNKGLFLYKQFYFSGLIPALMKLYVQWSVMRRYRK